MPSKVSYKNDLSGQYCSNADYLGAQQIWDSFQLKNLGELHDLYVGTDIHLLGIVLLIVLVIS